MAARAGRTPPPALVAATAILMLCHAVVPATAEFMFAPIMNVYALADRSARTYEEAQQTCEGSGGYLACEPTAATHQASVQAATGTGRSTYYAFLGGDTMGYRSPTSSYQCAGDVDTNNPTTGKTPFGATPSCVWHWNQGRWITYADDQSIYANIQNAGIAFFGSNIWDAAPFSVPLNSMSNYFFNETVGGSDANRRPGPYFGRYLLLVGDGGGDATWSDNNAGPGYQYKGYTYKVGFLRSIFDQAAIGSTVNDFIAICNIGTPVRIEGELADTTSGLQANWWAIFFAILFVLCLVAFIIVACCQEREDMDEPPEDAPEWAQKEANERQQNRSFISQRSFRAYSDDDDVDVNDNAEGQLSRAGSQRKDSSRPVSSPPGGGYQKELDA